MTEQSITDLKLQLEVEKLQAEIKTISIPFYARTSFWLSSLAVIAAFGAIMTGVVTGYFDNQKVLNELKSERLIKETKILEKQTASLRSKKEKLVAQIECFELSQQVNLIFLKAIKDHSSNKSKINMNIKNINKNFEGNGIIEIEKNTSLVLQAVFSAEDFRNVCNKLVSASVSDFKKLAREMYVTVLFNVPMLESRKSSKIEAVASMSGILKSLEIEVNTEYINEEWSTTSYGTWEKRIQPLREIANRKGGFLNTYLDSYFLENEYTDIIKMLFWPEKNEGQSISISGQNNLSSLINKVEKAAENNRN